MGKYRAGGTMDPGLRLACAGATEWM